jgi:hypothetical protein
MQHPEVFVPRIKEVHFFDKHYERGISCYEWFFCGVEQSAGHWRIYAGVLAWAYTSRNIPALMRQDLPGARLIARLRNPTERAYSRYWNSKTKYEKNAALTFEQKLAERPQFIAEGFYFDQLGRFYDLFPREQLWSRYTMTCETIP